MPTCLELNCSACCRGSSEHPITLILSRNNILYLRLSGTKLRFNGSSDPSLDRDTPPTLNGKYIVSMESICGKQGDDGKCLDYSNRPKICRTTQIGGNGCNSCRQAHNLPPVSKYT